MGPFITLHASCIGISSILLNNISLTIVSVKIERKIRKRENLRAIIRGFSVFGISLAVEENQGAYTPLQFKLDA